MRTPRLALAATALSCFLGCDTFLVEPAASPVEARFSFEPALAPPGVTYGDLMGGLGPVRKIAFRFIHDGITRDTVVSALRAGTSVHSRLLLRAEEARGWLEIQALLLLENDAAVFSGRGLVNSFALSPRATIELTPIAAEILGPDPDPFVALGDTFTIAAYPLFASGLEIEGARIEWVSAVPEIMEIVGTDRWVPRSNGQTIVTASSLGATRAYAVTVGQIPFLLSGVGPQDTTVTLGDSFQARPFGEDANGFPLQPGAGVFWDAGGAVTVTPEGMVTATALGVGSISASYSATSRSAQITVVP
jgi:hypothetical protein